MALLQAARALFSAHRRWALFVACQLRMLSVQAILYSNPMISIATALAPTQDTMLPGKVLAKALHHHPMSAAASVPKVRQLPQTPADSTAQSHRRASPPTPSPGRQVGVAARPHAWLGGGDTPASAPATSNAPHGCGAPATHSRAAAAGGAAPGHRRRCASGAPGDWGRRSASAGSCGSSPAGHARRSRALGGGSSTGTRCWGAGALAG